jgi:hypothetical protein
MNDADLALLGPACADWNDFVGTAAADDLEVSDASASLYQVAGLSPLRWIIAAVDVSVGADGCRVVIYAFDRQPANVSSYADLLEVADQQGELPVAAIALDLSSDSDGALGRLFRRVSVRLVARGLKDVPLVVTGAGGRHVSAPGSDQGAVASPVG